MCKTGNKTNMMSCLKRDCQHCFCRTIDRRTSRHSFINTASDSPRAHVAPKTILLPRTLVMLQRQHQLLLKEWWRLQRKRCSTAKSVWQTLSWLRQCRGEQQHVHYGPKLWDAYTYFFLLPTVYLTKHTRSPFSEKTWSLEEKVKKKKSQNCTCKC